MKRIYILISLIAISVGLFAQDYYWYKNQKKILVRGDERYVLFTPDAKSGIDSSAYIKIGETSDSSVMWGIQKSSAPLTDDIKYVSPSFLMENDTSNMYVTERFYVKLKQKEDYDMLVEYAASHGVEVVQRNMLKLWYVLSCTATSKADALYLANKFHESSLFAASEPEFINTIRNTCVDDPYFNQQWNLLNTGQLDNNNAGVDINYCAANAITTGADSIRIAVIDEGIASHFDVSYLGNYSIDAHTGTYPAQQYGSHGTKCAGVIGAHANNNHGVAGIAPDCPMISVSFKDDTPSNAIAAGIEFAVNQNAAVLSNSWRSYINSEFLDDAIDYALTEGRNGKGCVVVFAAGNDNTIPLAYPANSNPDIIAVGAMSPNITRASYYSWGSNYGHGLDMMAPGVNIPTTIPSAYPYQYMGSFTTDFGGTSAACPHVSAVAGLVLSVNPNLTQKEVATIIETTAQKVGNYGYDSIAPNGRWDFEMGYGLVDAYAAVRKAQLSRIEIEGPDYICDTSLYYVRNVPDSAIINWSFSARGNSLYGINGPANTDSVQIVKSTPIVPIIPPVIKGGRPIPMYSVLSVTVTKDGLSYTKQKLMYPSSVGEPSVSSTNTAQLWPINTPRVFTVTNCSEVIDERLVWTITRDTPLGPEVVEQTTGSVLLYLLDFTGDFDITVTNTENSCGNASTTLEFTGVSSKNTSPKRHSLPSTNDIVDTPQSSTCKILRDGQLYILHNDYIYNANGVLIKQF